MKLHESRFRFDMRLLKLILIGLGLILAVHLVIFPFSILSFQNCKDVYGPNVPDVEMYSYFLYGRKLDTDLENWKIFIGIHFALNLGLILFILSKIGSVFVKSTLKIASSFKVLFLSTYAVFIPLYANLIVSFSDCPRIQIEYCPNYAIVITALILAITEAIFPNLSQEAQSKVFSRRR